MVDMKEVVNQMKELEVKASKYDDLKEMLDETIAKINEKFNEIQDLISEISPLIAMRRKYRKKDTTGFGNVVISYVEKLYNYLVDTGEEKTIPDMARHLNMDEHCLSGGTGSKIKIALTKMHGIKFRIDANDRRRHLYSYDNSVKKLEIDIPTHIRDVVKKKKVGEIEVENSEELKDVLPKKFSHMG